MRTQDLRAENMSDVEQGVKTSELGFLLSGMILKSLITHFIPKLNISMLKLQCKFLIFKTFTFCNPTLGNW
jgi:hypothetical protein